MFFKFGMFLIILGIIIFIGLFIYTAFKMNVVFGAAMSGICLLVTGSIVCELGDDFDI